MTRIKWKNSYLSNRIIKQTHTFVTMRISRNKRKVLIFIHSIEISVKLSFIDLLDYSETIWMIMLQRLYVIDKITKNGF